MPVQRKFYAVPTAKVADFFEEINKISKLRRNDKNRVMVHTELQETGRVCPHLLEIQVDFTQSDFQDEEQFDHARTVDLQAFLDKYCLELPRAKPCVTVELT